MKHSRRAVLGCAVLCCAVLFCKLVLCNAAQTCPVSSYCHQLLLTTFNVVDVL